MAPIATSSSRWPKPLGPWLVELEWGSIDGRAEVTSFRLRSVGARQPVTAEALRSVPLGRLASESRRKLARNLREQAGDDRTLAQRRREYRELMGSMGQPLPSGEARTDDEVRLSDLAEPKAQAFERRPGGGRPRTFDHKHWADVAAVYSHAFASGLPPTTTVAEKFSVSVSAAGKWVAKCRAMGLLAPTTQGRPGGTR